MGPSAGTGADPLMLCPGDFPPGVTWISISLFLSALSTCLICVGPSFFKFCLVHGCASCSLNWKVVTRPQGLGLLLWFPSL